MYHVDCAPFRAGMAAPLDTALCVAGEARALIFPQVQARLRTTLIDALQADLYLVLSRSWSSGWHAAVKAATWTGLPKEVSEPNISSIIERLRPTAAIVSDASLESGGRWWAAVEAWWPGCTTSQRAFRYPGCSSAGRACTEAAFYASTCAGRLAEMVRWRACYALIEEGEARRVARAPVATGRYAFVVRARPDLWMPCVLPPLASWRVALASGGRAGPLSRRWVAFGWDFLALMPRAAAAEALGLLQLGENASACLRPGLHSTGHLYRLTSAQAAPPDRRRSATVPMPTLFTPRVSLRTQVSRLPPHVRVLRSVRAPPPPLCPLSSSRPDKRPRCRSIAAHLADRRAAAAADGERARRARLRPRRRRGAALPAALRREARPRLHRLRRPTAAALHHNTAAAAATAECEEGLWRRWRRRGAAARSAVRRGHDGVAHVGAAAAKVHRARAAPRPRRQAGPGGAAMGREAAADALADAVVQKIMRT